jgi:purine-binding chemotaxis protein CheW
MVPDIGDEIPRATNVSNREDSIETQPYLVVCLGEESYGIPGDCVREITRWREPTPVPGAPVVLPGIINQRGLIVPVVNMHPLLGLSPMTPHRATRYVIMKHNDVSMALQIDAAADFVELPMDSFEPPPPTFEPQHARFLRAIVRLGNQPVALLDPAILIAVLRAGA